MRQPAPGRRWRPPPRGFVLPMTVMLLALVSVGVALMSHRSDQLRQLVVASRGEQLAAVSAQNALARAMYLTSTLARRGNRLGDIAIDGQWYATADGTYVRFQDAAGLFNLKRARSDELAALLRALGVPDVKAAMLVDTLQDYVDGDSLARINGAEATEYAAAKLPPPRNNVLLAPSELQRIAGWNELDAATLRKVLANVYVGNINSVNRHTVTAAALAAVSGMDIEVARRLVAERAPGAALALESVPSVASGNYLLASRYMTQPSSTILLTVCPPAVAWCQHTSLTATPDESEMPWHLDYSLRQMRMEPLPPKSETAPLPDQPPKQAPPPTMTPFGTLQ